MILDSEKQREILMGAIQGGSYSGRAVEVVAALTRCVREAEVDAETKCPVEEAFEVLEAPE